MHRVLAGPSIEQIGNAMTAVAPNAPLLGTALQLGEAPPDRDVGQERLSKMTPIPLFQHCTSDELRAVASATRPHSYAADTVLFEQGAPGLHLYILLSGRIRIERDGETIVHLHDGTAFGEMALLDTPTRSATAVAETACDTLLISRTSFFNLLRGNPKLAVKILWNMLLRLSANLRSTSQVLAMFKAASEAAT